MPPVWRPLSRDHPRTRGVYWGPLRPRSAAHGSSPHARGLPHGFPRGHLGLTDHPRTRGVYAQKLSNECTRAGSSPHARGLRVCTMGVRGHIGIIPARAGFTQQKDWRYCSGSDHPRTRGVYRIGLGRMFVSVGSSPHARGLLLVRRLSIPPARIIPARAGFTPGPEGPVEGDRDHPRTRGVYRVCRCGPGWMGGSSPHARGLPYPILQVFGDLGIIPARAGFTLGDPWNPNGPGVYHPPVSFTADLVPARQSCGSAAVEPRWTMTPWAA